MAMGEIGFLCERLRGARPDHAALLDQVMAVDQAGHLLQVLVDHQNGLALGLQPAETGPNFLADDRRQPLGRFVQGLPASVYVPSTGRVSLENGCSRLTQRSSRLPTDNNK